MTTEDQKPLEQVEQIFEANSEPVSEIEPTEIDLDQSNKSEKVEKGILFNRIPQNVTPDNNTFTFKEKLSIDDDIVPLPTAFSDEISELLSSIPNIKLGDSKIDKKWARSFQDSTEQLPYNSAFKETLEDTTADFKNHVVAPGGILKGATPKIKQVENAILSGEGAVIRVMTELGLGAPFQTPLWASGIWVTFKTPSESDLIELHRIIVQDKINIGRETYGLIFSNISAYTVERLVNFAFTRSFMATTIKTEDIPAGGLMALIKSQDIPSLLWGLTRAIYTNGFAFERACTYNPTECTHVVKGIINVEELQYTNSNALTDWQKIHMSGRRDNSKSLADVERYQTELNKTQDQELIIKGLKSEISLVIKTPTIADYIDAGHRWISSIAAMVDETINAEQDENIRNEIIERHAQATTMCQYSHWISKIKLGSNVIEDRETIENNLKRFSQDLNTREQFFEGISKYINSSTISVIGIPAYKCPKCGKPNTKEDDADTPKEFKSIIPIDVMQTFFELLRQRISRIARR